LNLQRQTAVPKLPVHGEEVWGDGKKVQNLLLLHSGQVDLQVWGPVVAELKHVEH